jgi:hypothetical protein
VAELADVIKQRARQFRRYAFLDCCFAAEALKTFQGTEAVSRKVVAAFDENLPRRTIEFPRRGTALFCAADKDSVARSPLELERTMFIDALLSALTAGDAQYGDRMTLADVSELVWERLFDGYKDPVRPALHCPD